MKEESFGERLKDIMKEVLSNPDKKGVPDHTAHVEKTIDDDSVHLTKASALFISCCNIFSILSNIC